jgi:hypothetical protein
VSDFSTPAIETKKNIGQKHFSIKHLKMAFSAPFSAPQVDGDLAFGKFKQKCELMFKSILKDAEGEEQVSYILLWVGEQGLDIYNSWAFEDGKDQKDPAKILDSLWNIWSHGQIIEFTCRYTLYTRYATTPRLVNR